MWMISIIFSIGPTVCQFYSMCCANFNLLLPYLTLNPLTWKIWRAPNKASKWHMIFNSAFKGLKSGRCPWNLILKVLPFCPMYFILHVGQFSWYIPHLSYLLWVSSCCVDSRLSIALSVINAILILVLLNSFVMSLVYFLTYVNFVYIILFIYCFPF
jgi:hypothetical protein